jgi:hypothetical protein
MASAFESATRVAIEEIILERAETSKFGFFLSRDALADLTSDLFEFVKASRALKSAGDRMLGGAVPPQPKDRLILGNGRRGR